MSLVEYTKLEWWPPLTQGAKIQAESKQTRLPTFRVRTQCASTKKLESDRRPIRGEIHLCSLGRFDGKAPGESAGVALSNMMFIVYTLVFSPMLTCQCA